MRSRRFVIIRVEPDSIVQLMGGWKLHTQIGLPCFTEGADALGNRIEFPTDMVIEDVHYDWYSRSIQFRASHPSFAEVMDGEAGPVFSTRHVTVTVFNVKSGTGNPGDPLIVEDTNP